MAGDRYYHCLRWEADLHGVSNPSMYRCNYWHRRFAGVFGTFLQVMRSSHARFVIDSILIDAYADWKRSFLPR